MSCLDTFDVSSHSRSLCRACRVVLLACSTSSTQQKCMGSTGPTCRVVSRRDVTSQVEFGFKSYRNYRAGVNNRSSRSKRMQTGRIWRPVRIWRSTVLERGRRCAWWTVREWRATDSHAVTLRARSSPEDRSETESKMSRITIQPTAADTAPLKRHTKLK